MTDEMEPLSVEARLIADLGVQVARLTHQVAFRDMIIKELKHEIKTERAAVVAWLREVSERRFPRDEREQGIVFRLAHEIERGEHRREEEP
jgi:hypothetical protein